MRRNATTNPSRCITIARQIKNIFATGGSLGDIENILLTLFTKQDRKYVNTLMTRIIRAIPATSKTATQWSSRSNACAKKAKG